MFFGACKILCNTSRYKARGIFVRNIWTGVRNVGKPLQRKALLVQPKRNFLNSIKIFRRPSVEQCHVKDNVPAFYELIYRNRTDRYIYLVQIITTVSTFCLIAFLLATEEKAQHTRRDKQERLVYLASFIGLVVIMQVMVFKLPIRIYYWRPQKKYVYVFYGNYPFTQRQVQCAIGEVSKLEERGVLPWRQGRYNLENQQDVILFDDYFRRPADLYIMLGLQRDPEDDPETL